MKPKIIDKIEITKNDIANIKIDAIVNSATLDLLGGTGVDGRIHKVAGPKLREECKTLNGCMVGHAKITKAYDLPCKRVIHTVGPVYIDGKHREDIILSMCYKNSLKLLNLNELTSIAFPSISSGQFGFPIDVAAGIAITTTINELKNYPNIKQVVFCCYNDEMFNAYNKKLEEVRVEQEKIAKEEEEEMAKLRASVKISPIVKSENKDEKLEEENKEEVIAETEENKSEENETDTSSNTDTFKTGILI